MLRACRVLDKDVRNDVEKQIKYEFRKNQHIKDTIVIKSLLTEGRNIYKQLAAMNPNKQIDDDSWINSGDESDKRGRVGSGWPWQQQ